MRPHPQTRTSRSHTAALQGAVTPPSPPAAVLAAHRQVTAPEAAGALCLASRAGFVLAREFRALLSTSSDAAMPQAGSCRPWCGDTVTHQQRCLRAECMACDGCAGPASSASKASLATSYKPMAADEQHDLTGSEREITVCNNSGSLVASVHIYKAAGSYLRKWLQLGCHEVGGRILNISAPLALHALHAATLGASPPFVVAAVRDPVDRFISAMDELNRRHRWPKHRSLSELILSVERRGFWDVHLVPQRSFLLQRDRFGIDSPIPLDYLVRSEFACEAREVLLARLGASRLSRRPLPSRAQQAVMAHTSNPDEAETWPSLQEVRRLCALYRLDYVSLHLPLPRVCMGVSRTIAGRRGNEREGVGGGLAASEVGG